MRLDIMRRSSVAVACTAVLAVGAAGTHTVSAQGPSASAETSNPYAESGAVPGSGAGRTLGLWLPDTTSPWSALLAAGISAEVEAAGATLVTCGSPSGACGVPGGALRAVDAIIDLRAGSASGPAVCPDHAVVLAVDRTGPCDRTRVGADVVAAGRLAGTAMGHAIAQSGRCAPDAVLVLEGTPSMLPVGNRADGLVDGLQAVCGVIDAAALQRIPVSPDDTGSAAIASALGALRADAQVVVLADDDAAALRALDVVQQLGRTASVRFAAVGGLQAAWSAIACQPTWVGDGALFPERYGRTLVAAALDLIDGQELPAQLQVPIATLDATDIRAVYPDVPAC